MSSVWIPVSLWTLFGLALTGVVGWIIPVLMVLAIAIVNLSKTWF